MQWVPPLRTTTTAAAAAAEFAGAKWRLLGAKAAGKIRSCVREKASTQPV